MVYIPMSRDFIKLHQFVTLMAYVIFVKNVPFFITISRSIKLVAVEHAPTHTAEQFIKSLKSFTKL